MSILMLPIPRSVEKAVKAAISVFGRLDFAHNNAGVRAVANIADLAESDWKKVIDVNLTGVFLGMKYQIPEILKTQGAIVNTASIFGMKGVPERSAYAASKAGVISLTMTAASEYAEQGIRVNAVAPGFIATEAAQKTLGSGAQPVIARTPREKNQEIQPILRKLLFGFVAHYSPNVNGIVLPVDGGYMAN